MKQLYGTGAFTAAYGDAPNPMWTAAIAKLTDDECRRGLGQLAKQAREFPANLTQFVAACKHKPPQSYLGVPTTPDELRRALPAPDKQASPERVDSWIAKIRGRLA
jgi:hypothetical protein